MRKPEQGAAAVQPKTKKAMAVIDVDFNDLPASLPHLRGYASALVLLRLRGRPVGQALLPVVDGKIGGERPLSEALMRAANWSFWQHWLRDYLSCGEEENDTAGVPAATVAVCTRDRPRDLERCLAALIRLPDDGQELLVVDNCPSTDATRRLVKACGRVRYVREDRPGLNVARNRALREAAHDIVAFTDDDAAPDPGWLRALVKNFRDPLVLCVTGLTMPRELATEAQQCFEHFIGFAAGFRRTVFEAATHNPLEGWMAGAGVNMALRRAVLDRVGPFDEALDAGTPTLSGGDNDMFGRVLAAGYRIVYEPEALNWHRHRYSWKELREQFYSYGVGGFAAWTRALLVDGEAGVLRQAEKWSQTFWPTLTRSLLGRPGGIPLDLLLRHFLGCAVGPWAYLYSRWSVNRRAPRYGAQSG
ncbi:MAG TPA: glycosyltransferase [Candidatus Acidoferrales bacterium]|nr:glycosyltransferase [Candidatus Acidoferrales bacterium]